MQVLHPGQGERRAIVGYDGQYRVSASLILDGLLEGYMEWVRVADPEAGQVDDLQVGSQGRIDAYQVKWSQFSKPFTFNHLASERKDSPGLIAQLALGWKTLQNRYPNERVVVHLVTNDTPSPRAKVPTEDPGPSPSHFAAFVEQAWKPAQRSLPNSLLDVPRVWLPAWNTLRDASGLEDDEFQEFVRDCVLEFDYQVDRFRTSSLPREQRYSQEDNEQIELMLFQTVADPAQIIHLSREDLLKRLRWTNRFDFRNRHILPVDESSYQPIESTKCDILSALENLPGGYIAVVGSPGSGKSTLLTRTLRGVDARVVSYYSYIPDAQSPTTTRGESVNFLHDVVLTIVRAGFRVEGVSNRPERGYLLDQLHHQMELLGKDWVSSGRKTIILIDGLDHIDREQHPDRSLLLDLPAPDRVPDGVYFILGTQTDMILPAHIRSSVQRADRRVEMQPLERQQVFAVIESAETATKLTDDLIGTVYQLSGGHPLYLAYIINKIKGVLNSEDLNKELQEQPMLLYMSSGFNEYLVWLADDRVDFTSDIAFKATDDFDLAHSFCGSSAQVRLRPQIVA